MPLNTSLSGSETAEQADLILKIDYDETFGSAARAFEIAAELIHALEDLDRIFSQTIHAGLRTSLIVEDLQKSSLKLFLKNVVEDIPDEALKEADLKKLLGHYLIKAKYAAVRWLDEPKSNHKSIRDLTEEVAFLAKETDLRRLPDYPPPNPVRLAQPLDRFQETKKRMRETEGITITLGKDEYKVDLNSTWLPSETVDQVEADKELENFQDIYLIIGKPDFIGKAKWHFRHGKRSLQLRVEDEEWLEEFRAGHYPLKPGDALRVRLRTTHKYDVKGDLIETDEAIAKVLAVIEDQNSQADLF
ncbi:hypothetical protein [Parasedimentitalea huanghaiensis]|uniref:Uncharacterized protein n=1 Tax=Parasedimentitalea huanghaiensis TaxID=2682100 RepID=A0A6L6WF80_9RHOB|nr:hypothetical protein [Zongyanglinia huanghaiensis]MVO16090.1 hypothetical protein [Zongyanglinia huanghaiensis]